MALVDSAGNGGSQVNYSFSAGSVPMALVLTTDRCFAITVLKGQVSYHLFGLSEGQKLVVPEARIFGKSTPS